MSAEIHTLKTGDLAKNSDKKKEDYDAVVHNVFNCLNVQLLQNVSDMLSNADESLSELATHTESAELKAKYEGLMQILRQERGNIDKGFFISINEKLNSDSTAEDELSLVDQDEMEEIVAITTMYTNAMNAYGREVNYLEARLEFIEKQTGCAIDKNALDPRHICEAFQSTLKNINMGLEYKLLLFKLFDMQVSSQLGGMYKSLNKLFIDAGILPKIKLKAKKEDSVEKPIVRTAKYYDPQENKAENFIPRSKEDINYFISQFMNGFTTATGEDIPESFKTLPTDKDNRNCYARKDVMGALSKLQNDFRESDKKPEAVDTEQIKQSIVADMGSNNGGTITKQVNLLDQRSIDFVGMMFNEITHDESISKVVTNLLLRLQIPVIKVAMMDQDLFSKEDHPARNSLDLISQAGKGVTEENDRVYCELEKIVDGILEEYDVDIASFERAVDALQTLIKTEEEITAENERQEQRAAIRAHARDVVMTELRHLSSNKKLPKNVKPLVLKHWSSLMFNRYLQYGKESNQWLQSVMLLKLLIKCLQPIKSKTQWQLLSKNHKTVVAAVNKGLSATQQDKAEINAQIETLKATFLKMLNDYGFKMVQEEKARKAKADENKVDNVIPFDEEEAADAANDVLNDGHDEEVARIEEQAKVAREKIKRLPNELQPGVWFEIFNGKDKPIRRLKLSVVLTEVAKLIFVDRHGVKVIEKDADDFVNELENNKSKFIADHSTFEHALGTVIHKLAA